MTSRTELIELCSSYWSELIALDQLSNYVFITLNLLLAQPVDINAVGDTLSDLQILILGFNKVIDTFIINLNIANINLKLPALLLFNHIIDLSNREWNETLFSTACLIALHGVSFTRAGLTIYENGLIDAV